MLPIDHIPFHGPDLEAIAEAFAALGFTASPQCAYVSPDFPEAHWRNRCVFLERGWFDLLHAPEAPADAAARPGGCLFLTDDLRASEAQLGEMRRHAPYRLRRVWGDDAACETFELTGIRERIAPLGLAVIEHAYPCPDAQPEWFAHPNSAIEIAGLIFGGAEPGPFAAAAGRTLDLSGFAYWSADAFAAAFGPDAPPIAIRVRVGSLDAARQALAPAASWKESAGALHVAGPAPLACGFQFFT